MRFATGAAAAKERKEKERPAHTHTKEDKLITGISRDTLSAERAAENALLVKRLPKTLYCTFEYVSCAVSSVQCLQCQL